MDILRKKMSIKQKTIKKIMAIKPQEKISKNSLRKLFGDGLGTSELPNDDIKKKIMIKSALNTYLLES